MKKQFLFLTVLGLLTLLNAGCFSSSSSSASSSTDATTKSSINIPTTNTAAEEMTVDEDGKMVKYNNAQYAKYTTGSINTVQVDAWESTSQSKHICLLWYVDSFDKVKPGTYDMLRPANPNNFAQSALYQIKTPFETYHNKTGKITVDSFDGKNIKGSFDMVMETVFTPIKSVHIKGNFNAPVKK